MTYPPIWVRVSIKPELLGLPRKVEMQNPLAKLAYEFKNIAIGKGW